MTPDDLAARLEATEGVLRDMQSDSYAYLAGQEDGRRWERQELYNMLLGRAPASSSSARFRDELLEEMEIRQGRPGTLHITPRVGRVYTDSIDIDAGPGFLHVLSNGVRFPGVTYVTFYAAGGSPAISLEATLTPPKPLDD